MPKPTDRGRAQAMDIVFETDNSAYLTVGEQREQDTGHLIYSLSSTYILFHGIFSWYLISGTFHDLRRASGRIRSYEKDENIFSIVGKGCNSAELVAQTTRSLRSVYVTIFLSLRNR